MQVGGLIGLALRLADRLYERRFAATVVRWPEADGERINNFGRESLWPWN